MLIKNRKGPAERGDVKREKMNYESEDGAFLFFFESARALSLSLLFFLPLAFCLWLAELLLFK